jgi:hypothetical protein
MSLAFALMAAINGSTGSCATLSHGLERPHQASPAPGGDKDSHSSWVAAQGAAWDAVAQLFRVLAGGYELRADVDSVKRREGCSVRDCGELVAVQLGQVVCRHQ